MAKQMRCADVVPGCDYTAWAETEEELMELVVAHARTAHPPTLPKALALEGSPPANRVQGAAFLGIVGRSRTLSMNSSAGTGRPV
jgi:predicted small metal-binding protein